ncbi:dynein axonemal heavy chain 7-like [Mytilus trossulus]|uniref:dynein axonemal heavy chain 7-like n=1 Tax=Mytilus trossulus TaxID=6551 RepID=UPI0030049D96
MMATQEVDINLVMKDMNKITRADLCELKSLSAPPSGVIEVMQAVCLLLGNGKCSSWTDSQKQLSDPNSFLQRLKNVDKDNIRPSIMTKIRKTYTSDPDFTFERMLSKSKAAGSLCRWVIAMDQYDKHLKNSSQREKKTTEKTNKSEKLSRYSVSTFGHIWKYL